MFKRLPMQRPNEQSPVSHQPIKDRPADRRRGYVVPLTGAAVAIILSAQLTYGVFRGLLGSLSPANAFLAWQAFAFSAVLSACLTGLAGPKSRRWSYTLAVAIVSSLACAAYWARWLLLALA